MTDADQSARWRGQTVLITGGLGFIGSNLALRLADLGAKVRVIDAIVEGGGGNPANLANRPDIDITLGDLRDADLGRLLAGVSAVFHLAAQVSHTRSMRLPIEDLELNCRATLALLEAVRRMPDSPFLVYAGSRSQYGSTHGRVDETHPLRPVDVNGIHKAAAEALVLLYDQAFERPACSLRIGNVYGPRHQMRHAEQGFLHWFIRQAMDSGTISVFGGEQQRDFVYVDDVVDAVLAAPISEASHGEAINVAAGTSRSVADLARSIVEAVGTGRVEVTPYTAEHKAVEVGDFVADIGKAERILGWRPRTVFEDGLRQTIAFYRRRKAEYW
jgi:UDP-glucose 4-epimerase